MVLTDRITGGPSAYSKIGFETCTRLAKLGHDVAHIPMGMANKMGKYAFGSKDGKVLLYPSGNDIFAEDVAVEHYRDFKADMLVTIKEPWVFRHIFRHAINFVPMAIIDHSPVSSAITARLQTAFKVIAVSRFGQLELRNKHIESTYIPHGVRCDVYKQLEDKAKCKELFYLDPDAFVVGVVAMNRVRKRIPRMLRGFKRFVELNPDVKIQMMLWTNIQPTNPQDTVVGVSDSGVNLLPEIVDLELNEIVHWPKWDDIEKIGGLPEWDPQGGWDMVKLYNAMDAHFLCSGGEAVGLPYLESAACGVYSVGTDYAGATEHIGPGITVPYSDYEINNTPGVRYVMADIDKMAEGLTKILNGNSEKMARKARRFAERFDWPNIISHYWKPFLDKCREDLYPLVTKDGIKSWRDN